MPNPVLEFVRHLEVTNKKNFTFKIVYFHTT